MTFKIAAGHDALSDKEEEIAEECERLDGWDCTCVYTARSEWQIVRAKGWASTKPAYGKMQTLINGAELGGTLRPFIPHSPSFAVNWDTVAGNYESRVCFSRINRFYALCGLRCVAESAPRPRRPCFLLLYLPGLVRKKKRETRFARFRFKCRARDSQPSLRLGI